MTILLPGTANEIEAGSDGTLSWYSVEHGHGSLLAFHLAAPFVAPVSGSRERDVFASLLQGAINAPTLNETVGHAGLSVKVACRPDELIIRGSCLTGFGQAVTEAVTHALTKLNDEQATEQASLRYSRQKKLAAGSPARSAQTSLMTHLGFAEPDMDEDRPLDHDLIQRLRSMVDLPQARLCVTGRGSRAFAAAVRVRFHGPARELKRSSPSSSATPVLPREPVRIPGSDRDAYILVGGNGPTRAEPDFAAAEVVMSLLGGSPASLLFKSLRDGQGFSYGPTSRIGFHQGHAAYSIAMHTPPEHVISVQNEIHRQLDNLTDQLLPETLVRDAARYVRGTYLLSLATVAGQAAALGAMLPRPGLTAIAEYPSRLSRVGAEDVLRISRRLFADGRRITLITQGRDGS